MKSTSESRRVLGTTPSVNGPDIRASDQKSNGILGQIIQCPICMEDMQSLGQLNRHLDDEHVEVAEAVSEIGVRSWFQKQLSKSSVAAVGKTLGMADDFERNGDQGLTATDSTKQTDALVTNKHWQLESATGRCSEEGCNRALKSYRSINCRHCGKLYCGPHTAYQMRLSRSAIYEPQKGIWCRVCRKCYEERSWYDDSIGNSRDLSPLFQTIRQRQVDLIHLKSQMLERRMTKLLEGLSSLDVSGSKQSYGFLSAFSGKTSEKRNFEQTIVPWEDEKLVHACAFCTRPFFLDQGKHHCRMCGRCVCGDVSTQCSSLVDFNTSNSTETSTAKLVKVRICRDCNADLFKHSDYAQSQQSLPAYDAQYRKIRRYRAAIDNLMPRYEKFVSTGSREKRDVEEMNRIRKCITDSIAQVESLSKSIGKSPTTSVTQQKLQNAIMLESTTYLQSKLLLLQSIAGLSRKSTEVEPLAPIVQNLAEQQTLRDEIAMFTEQRYLLQEQAEDAIRRRKFEDHTSIHASIEEIDRELEERQKQLILWSGDP